MKYKNPAMTVDILVLTIHQEQLEILLISRKKPPFKGSWAIPGGFVEIDETLETAAKRELEEETHLKNLSLLPLKIFDTVDRDPRGRTISMAYWTFISDRNAPIAGDDAAKSQWFPLSNLPKLAFDHLEIIETLKKQLINFANNASWLSLANDFKVQDLVTALKSIQ